MDSERNFQPDRNLRLMDQVRQVLRYHHYRYRTEQTYCKWILRYIRHHGGKTHPKTMGKTEIESFLTHLAVRQRVSASTQRQALNAIMFLYRKVLGKDIRISQQTNGYQYKKSKTNGAIATKALANKLARATFCMMRDQTMFDVKKIFS